MLIDELEIRKKAMKLFCVKGGNNRTPLVEAYYLGFKEAHDKYIDVVRAANELVMGRTIFKDNLGKALAALQEET